MASWMWGIANGQWDVASGDFEGRENGREGEREKATLAGGPSRNAAQAREKKNGLFERRRSEFPFFRVPERSSGPAGPVLIFWSFWIKPKGRPSRSKTKLWIKPKEYPHRINPKRQGSSKHEQGAEGMLRRHYLPVIVGCYRHARVSNNVFSVFVPQRENAKKGIDFANLEVVYRRQPPLPLFLMHESP